MFQVVSAYTNTGMSLVDTSLIPFQRAYTLLFPLIFLVLAGNTAFVSCLLFSIARIFDELFFAYSLFCESNGRMLDTS
jgi:Trk-type K+ transport system membrane component